MEFYGRYSPHFLSWGRGMIDRDPYDVADEVFNEAFERQMAAWKIDLITHTFNYPTFFELDRDIVHPAAYELATKYGQPLAPVTVDEVIHDLCDVARFRQGRQVKTEPLLDQLIDFGAPGILAFADACAHERATGKGAITDYYFDGYNTVARFRQKLQDFSSDLPPDLGVGSIFDELAGQLHIARTRDELKHFRSLPPSEQGEWRMHLYDLVFQLIGANGPRLSGADKELMLVTPDYFTPAQQVKAWGTLAEKFLPKNEDDARSALVVQILQELKRHPEFHGLFLEQARELSASPDMDFGANKRERMRQLEQLIPEAAYRLSSDPQAVRRRVDEFRRLRRDDPDSEGLLPLAAAIFIRLDEAENYQDLIAAVRGFGALAHPVLEEIVEVTAPRDERRALIRQTALQLLVSRATT